MKYTIITALIMLTACSANHNGLQTPERDVVADIIKRAEYDAQQITVQIVDRDVALNLLSGDYK
jgi:uncharacterized protein YcfL